MIMTSSEDNENDDDRPSTPAEEDCCGNACNPCVFDVHKKLLEEWNKRKLNKVNVPPDKNYLSPMRYSSFIIENIAKACEDCVFIYLDCKSKKDDDVLFLSASQHVMIKLGTITKPYTPISWNKKSIKLLIKLYPNGKASNYIRNLKIGNELLVRGPYGEFNYFRNSHKHVIMLSIGSGIAATYPTAHSIVQDEMEDTKVHMILGFRYFSHVPLKDELRLLSDFWNFECTLYLSQESDVNITGVNVVNNRLNNEIISETLNSYSPESTLILICGTTEFNDKVEKIIKNQEFLHYHVFR